MSRSLHPAILAMVAIPFVAAEDVETWGGRDLIVLHSGAEISGRVLADDGSIVALDLGFAEVHLEKARITRIEPGHGTPTRRAAPPPDAGTGRPSAGDWEASAGLTWGMHMGSLDAVGSVTSATTTSAGSLSLAVDGMDAGPGGWLRLASRYGPLAYGVQAATSTASGDSTSLAMHSPEAVLGLGLGPAASMRWDLVLAAGWVFARAERELHLRDASGTVVDTASTDDAMRGPIIRLEIAPSRRCGDWRIGAVAGLSWCSLTGSSTWVSNGGGFSGSDDLTARLTAAYLGATATRSW